MYIAKNFSGCSSGSVALALAVHRKLGGKGRRFCGALVFCNSLRLGVWLARTSQRLADNLAQKLSEVTFIERI